MSLGRRELSIGLLVFGAIVSIYFVLLAGPISAQNGGTTNGQGDKIDIDDRDQTNVCNNVINILLFGVQNPNVNNSRGDQEVLSGDVSNAQVVDIAQELNISPEIVQQCIQQNAGRDAIIGDNDDSNNNNSSSGGNKDVDTLKPIEKPGDVLNEITTKDLPNTGGSSFLTRSAALMVVFGGSLLVLRLVLARR